MVAPKLRSSGKGPVAAASDPGTFMAEANVLTPAGEVRIRQETLPNAGPGDASKQEGGRWQDLLGNEVQQGQAEQCASGTAAR